MNRAWLSLLLSLWPLLVGALVFVEVAAYFGSRRFLRLLVFTGIVVFALLAVLDYVTQPTSYAMQTRPIAYFFVVAWTVAVPLTVLSVGAYLLGKLRPKVWRHVGLCLLSVGVIAALPIFALWSICASGVDCV
jgi:hypothetical protein